MTGKPQERISATVPVEGARLHAPSFERNVSPLCDLLLAEAPETGKALEIASGTGQHVVAFARNLPGLAWQPTDIEPERLASIDAWAADSGLTNIRPARALDATAPGWAGDHGGHDLVMLCNLLHLIAEEQAHTLIREAMQALAAGGRFILYGPFKRDGQLTSPGDAAFHAHIAGLDPALGYKNDTEVGRWLMGAGAAEVRRIEMPANNLAFVARV